MKITGNESAYPILATKNHFDNQFPMPPQQGLTIRQVFAMSAKFDEDEFSFKNDKSIEYFIGRVVDWNDMTDKINALIEVEAKIKVMKADALIAELNKGAEAEEETVTSTKIPLKVRVPDLCDVCSYLTPGKEYPIIEIDESVFNIVSDEGDIVICRFKGCHHLNGGDWIITEYKEV